MDKTAKKMEKTRKKSEGKFSKFIILKNFLNFQRKEIARFHNMISKQEKRTYYGKSSICTILLHF